MGHPGVNVNDAVQLAICHFLLVSHWNRVSIFSRFRDIRPPKTRARTQKDRHTDTPQVILYSVPCIGQTKVITVGGNLTI